MRLSIVAVLLAFSPAALAQDVVWAEEEVVSERFPEGEVEGPTFAPGDRLEVILREGDRLRVRAGDRYGWVPGAVVSAEPPEQAAVGGDFDLEALKRSLQMELQSPGGAGAGE